MLSFCVFGDGKNTIYLKAGCAECTACSTTYDANKTKVKEMNPKWAKERGDKEDNWNINEKAAACDPSKWEKYYDKDAANYVIGAPSVEMYVKSYNQVYENEDGAYVLGVNYGETTSPGYIYTLNGKQSTISNSDYYTGDNSLDGTKYNSMYCEVRVSKTDYWWLASPSSFSSNYLCYISASGRTLGYTTYSPDYCVSPLISLKSNSILKIEN